MANFSQFFAGTPSSVSQLQRFTPQQQGIMQSLLQGGQQGLQNPYKGFDPIANYARSQFNQQVVPGLAEQFTGLGSNKLSSGAFGAALGQGASQLEQALAAQQAQFGQQNINQLLQMLQLGLTPQFENIPIGGQSGLGAPLLQSLFQATPGALFGGLEGGITGGLSGGPIGALIGALLGGGRGALSSLANSRGQ